jgi:hypothetical protein
MKKKFFEKSSYIFRIVILILLFAFNTFNGQQKIDNDTLSTNLVLENGVMLFSADESFNTQIYEKKIIIRSAHLSILKSENSKALVAVSGQKTYKLALQLKSIEKKKQIDAIRYIRKKIDNYRAKSKSFEIADFKPLPSSSQFLSGHSVAKNYILPRHNVHEFLKICTKPKDQSLQRSLNDLHIQKFIHYNNKSLDFCFSKVFSVRPPPVLV